jgi:hypothetical protein
MELEQGEQGGAGRRLLQGKEIGQVGAAGEGARAERNSRGRRSSSSYGGGARADE